MKGLIIHSEAVTAPLENERWALVQRVASSRPLGKASQLRDILFYICRRVLVENANSISAQEIGCKVLGRREDFNPIEDNIVRAQVRHLRRKLEEYFSSDGANETLILTIPKGGYVPHFESRTAVKAGYLQRKTLLLWVLLAGMAVTVAAFWSCQETLHHAGTVAGGVALENDPLWRTIFAPGRETSIVMADTSLVMLQDVLNVDVSLSEYLGGGYPEKLIARVTDPQLNAALKLIATQQYTSVVDATIAARLMAVSHRYEAHTNVRYSRDISMREFKTGNFILIGSRRGAPLVQLFEPQLNFFLEEDHQTRKYRFRNRTPEAGEQAVYGTTNDRAANAETYADIALLPNLAATGYVMILAGLDMTATEAAGDLVASTDFPATLRRLLASRAGQPPAFFIEILLQVKTIGGASAESQIIAHRLLK